MIKIVGKAICAIGFSFCNTDKILYPRGRHLRGAFGYIALNLGLKVSDYFLNISNDDLIFRDMIPFCDKCGLLFEVNRESDSMLMPFTVCKCKNKYDAFNMLVCCKTSKGIYKEVKEGMAYRIEIIIQNEDFFEDILKILHYIDNYNFYIGKKGTMGAGKFLLKEYKVLENTPITAAKKGDKILLLSDLCCNNTYINMRKTQTIIISHKIGEQMVHKEISVIRTGNIIQVQEEDAINYVGALGGLGFGEFRRL